jgi:hypothetical protein
MITPESTSCSELRVALWKKWLASAKIFQLYVDQLETVRKVRVSVVRTYSINTVLSPQPQSPWRRPGTKPRGLTSSSACGFLYGSTSMYWYCNPLASRATQTRCTNGLGVNVSWIAGGTDVTRLRGIAWTGTHQKQLPNNFNSWSLECFLTVAKALPLAFL